MQRLISQIERLEEEKKATADDISDKYAEAKALGFDPKIMKKIVGMRKKPKADLDEEQALIDSYLHAIGWGSGSLGFANADRETEAA